MARDPSPRTIPKQIETAADFYPPSTYGGVYSFLTYYNDLGITIDPIGDQYFPPSTVSGKSKNPVLFAIGVIPPSANITGLLLDRTSAVNTVQPADPQNASINTQMGTVKIVNPSASSAGKEQVPNKITRLTADQARSAFYNGFIQVTGQPPSEQVLALLMAQSAQETGNWAYMHNNNFGNVKATSGWKHQTTTFGCWELVNGQKVTFPPGTPQSTFRSYPTASEGAADHILTLLQENQRRHPPDAWKQALLTGDPDAFAEILSHPPPYYTGSKVDYTKAMEKYYGQFLGMSSVSQDSYNGNWQGSGKDDAGAAQQARDQLANTPVTTDNANVLYSAAQKSQILALKGTLDGMKNTPPLRMLVNPSSFSVRGEKIVSDGNWSRNGRPIIEHWGNGQEKISASGKVAGFYAIDMLNAVGPGLTRMARNYSKSWQNFQSLRLFYANNGRVHTRDVTSENQDLNMAMVGSVYLYYDSILYVGSFDSLTITETDAAPFTVEYSFEFTVRSAFLLDNANPNDKGTYGNTNIGQDITTSAFR